MTNTSNHQKRNTILGVLALLLAIALLIVLRFSSRVTLYDDPNTSGNTSGNLLNGGLFCESDGRIYFANLNDQNTLYSMNEELADLKKVYDDNVSYINAAGKYIFYTRRNDKKKIDSNALLALSSTGLFRITTKGTKLSKLYENPTQAACLYGNYVYYQHYDDKKGLQLYAAKIDGSSNDLLLSEPVAPYSVTDSTIYYSGAKEDHAIHSMNINGSSQQVISTENCTSLTRQGDHLYYLDMSRDYALARVNLDGTEPEILAANRIATYNVDQTESTIYYQIDDGQNNGLYQKDLTNGGTPELIAAGDYNYLHLVSDYLFYENYDGSKAYVMDVASGASRTFNPKVKK